MSPAKTTQKKDTKVVKQQSSNGLSRTVALKPRMSEKAYSQSVNLNVYVFEVPLSSNKAVVSDAVQDQFGVTVEDVRLCITKGKVKRSARKRQRPALGKRADMKKAYVQLKAGDKINIFGEEDKKKSKSKESDSVSTDKKTTKPQAQTKIRSLRSALGRAPRQTQNRGGEK